MNDIPNGFTGFTKRNPNFVSAGEAMRRSQSNQANSPSSYKQRKNERGFFGGWQPEVSASPKQDSQSAFSRASQAAQHALAYALPNTPAGERPQFDPDKLAKIAETERRWAWVEIDRSAIRHNTSTVKHRLAPGTHLMAVVKADAYGHGAIECARTALNSGADYLGVATVDEAIQLREALINAPILILAEPPATAIPLLLAYKIMPTIYTAEFAIQYAEAADAFSLRAPFHLAVNTGMNRIGVHWDEVVPFMRQISFHRALDLVGTFTHFATADCHDLIDFERQAKRFVDAINALRLAAIDPGIVHASNSAAIIRFPNVHFDMVRLGISLYGFHPCMETYPLIDLRPAMSVKARITEVKKVPFNEGVSYGLHYKSSGSVQICTLPIGYADGLRRGLSSRTDFLLEGRRMHQVGNICMDQCMFEVDLRDRMHPHPQIGDEVVIVGTQGEAEVTVDEMCRVLDTIPHEVTIGFGCSRLPRLYK